jgi:hypothetical protein
MQYYGLGCVTLLAIHAMKPHHPETTQAAPATKGKKQDSEPWIWVNNTLTFA